MRTLLLLLFFLSCAHEHREEVPSWVSAIRSGEESLRVIHGPRIFFRRLAGGPGLSRQTSCELAVLKALEDMKREFQQPETPHNVDVIFYDSFHQDCAVTLSVNARSRETASVELAPEDEASRILVERGETAVKFALTGLTLEEFERFTGDKVVINSGESLCQTFFRLEQFSIHGPTHVCWGHHHVQGYCTPRTGQCWVRTPQ